ncbi:MAG TPA: FliI/YscN family ATPase [Acidobacteriaceae bacterium]|nr:FliI/YscN family ATPase [Acidobacteriaceae bacterium]
MTPALVEVLDAYLRRQYAWRWAGNVLDAAGQSMECAGPLCSIGDCCEIVDATGRRYAGEVIGFRGQRVLAMPLEGIEGIRHGDTVVGLGRAPEFPAGEGLIGRVLDAVGNPLDDAGPLHSYSREPIHRAPPAVMDRVPIRQPLSTGVRALDAMLTVGIGQRIGIFGGSGVGKSTLIGMMTRNTSADAVVVALVGERGREVGEFLEDALGAEGRRRAVVIVSTSDQSPPLRMRAALAATSVAENFAAEGKNVLLVLDSLTRFAMAARDVGLAAGEPPTAKGYTPSVFNRVAKLVERAGRFRCGSITAFYTVLMEGDDQQDPVVDAVRSFVDGHVMLSRALASEGWYPPIHVLDSLSRLMPAIISAEHLQAAGALRRSMALHDRAADLIRIGAYKAGTDAELDHAIALQPVIRTLLTQEAQQRMSLDETVDALLQVQRA